MSAKRRFAMHHVVEITPGKLLSINHSHQQVPSHTCLVQTTLHTEQRKWLSTTRVKTTDI